MSDRRETLETVVDKLRAQEGIDNAFVAKSFTDQLIIVDIERDAEMPESARETLAGHGLRGIDDVYGEGDNSHSVVGDTGDVTRHHFVDVQTRGSHQSYVVK